jgi:hypothetical protein
MPAKQLDLLELCIVDHPPEPSYHGPINVGVLLVGRAIDEVEVSAYQPWSQAGRTDIT